MQSQLRTAATFFLFSFLFLFRSVYAQVPFLKNYTVSDGLPSSDVYCTEQDDEGYIWISTESGVSRFDGISFKNFTTKDGLSDNTVVVIKKDYYGRLWFVPLTGLPTYFYKGEMHSIQVDPEYRNNSVLLIIEDKQHFIYFSTKGGVLIIDKEGVVKFFPLPNYMGMYPVLGYSEHVGQPMYMIADTSNYYYPLNILSYDGKTLQLKSYHLPDMFYDLVKKARRGKTRELMNLIAQQGDSVYLADKEMVSLLSKVLAETQDLFPGLLKIEAERCYISSNTGGLTIYDKSYLKTGKTRIKLKGYYVASFFTDRDQNLWIPTVGNGIFFVPNSGFKLFYKPDGLADDNVQAISGKGNTIYLGYNRGDISIYENGHFRTLSSDSYYKGYKQRIISILPARDGKMWFALDDGFACMDKNTFKHILPGNTTKCIAEVEGDGFIAGSYNSFFKFSSDGKIDTLSVRYGLYPTRTTSAFAANDNSLWFGTDKGLVKISRGKAEQFAKKDRRLLNRISAIRQLADSTILCASSSFGLILIKGDSIRVIDENDKLISNITKCIFIDPANKDQVWVGTNKGISRITFEKYNPLKFNIENFNSTNGLSSDEVNGIYVYNDTVWVATIHGLTMFNKNFRYNLSGTPPVYITGVHINDADSAIHTMYDLPYNFNNLKINFTGISYRSFGKIQYRYRLSGLDSGWVYTNYPQASYPSLPAGNNYHFMVQAKGIEEVWSENPKEMYFRIHEAWWQTWWFKIFAALLLMLTGSGVIYIRTLRIRKREEEKTKLNRRISEMELKALRSQMNPHFIFNSMNSIQSIIAKGDITNAQRYIERFAFLMRSTFDHSGQNLIPLSEEIETIRAYMDLESLRFDNTIEFNMQMDPKINSENCAIPSMLIQPFLENAIWHGLMHKKDNRKLTLDLVCGNDQIICIIEDNGIGRLTSDKEAGSMKTRNRQHGAEVTRERMELLQHTHQRPFSIQYQDLKNEKQESIGTRVVLVISVFEW